MSETIDLLATEPTEASTKAAKPKPRERPKCPYGIQYRIDGGNWADYDVPEPNGGDFEDTAAAKKYIVGCNPHDDTCKVLFENQVQIVSVKWRGNPIAKPAKIVVSLVGAG